MDVLSLGLAELDKGGYYEWEDNVIELGHMEGKEKVLQKEKLKDKIFI